MTIAERNRKLKSIVAKFFHPTKVTVRGSRGTAYGWVTLKIDYAPKSIDERRTLEAMVWHLIKSNNIEIDTYGYNDPGSDYGYGSKIHISFDQVQA